ncbi:hypothetical protein [Enterococcus avium]|uniref:hypothetical protein n=1 Tax=Enterococcus avium TaxID=33945 RepID=UPI0032E50C09
MNKILKIAFTSLLGCTCLLCCESTTGFAESVTTSAPSVVTEMIPGYDTKAPTTFTIQPVPLHTAEIVNRLNPSNPKKTGIDVLKFLHPTYSQGELSNMTATFDESLSYLTNQKVKFTKINKPLDSETILNELKQKRPVLVHLKATSNYWLEPESAVIIYGFQSYNFPGVPPMTMYLARSLNHQDNPIVVGSETNYDLLLSEKGRDPSIKNVFYKWDSTAYGFTK